MMFTVAAPQRNQAAPVCLKGLKKLGWWEIAVILPTLDANRATRSLAHSQNKINIGAAFFSVDKRFSSSCLARTTAPYTQRESVARFAVWVWWTCEIARASKQSIFPTGKSHFSLGRGHFALGLFLSLSLRLRVLIFLSFSKESKKAVGVFASRRVKSKEVSLACAGDDF